MPPEGDLAGGQQQKCQDDNTPSRNGGDSLETIQHPVVIAVDSVVQPRTLVEAVDDRIAVAVAVVVGLAAAAVSLGT